MPTFEITSPDGRKFRVTGPEGSTADQALAQVQAQHAGQKQGPEHYGGHNLIMGGIKGAANIGATLMRPVDAALNATGLSDKTNEQRRADLGQFFKENADPESGWFKGGELASEIAGTAGVGGVLAKGAQAVGAAPKIVSALESGGMSLTPKGSIPVAAGSVGEKLMNMGVRTGAGAVAGASMAGLVNPDDVGTGAVIGGALPGAVKAAGMAGKSLGGMVPRASDEVAALAKRASDLGIRIPADRLVNSKPLNAAAASLNYIPFSGRAATEANMLKDMNRALSKTFGQNNENIAKAIADAEDVLGKEFDRVLTSNTVKVTPKFKQELAENFRDASQGLPPDWLSVVKKQFDILDMAPLGAEIDGNAAYAIKRSLDKISKQNTPAAEYARDLKKTLMGGLNDSLGKAEAEAFAKTRQQYGRMIELRKLAPAGAESEISAARLANTKPRDKELREIADIASQFIKSRESPHGAAQRVTLGSLASLIGLGTGTLPAIGAGIATGRVADMALNSNAVRNMMLRGPASSKSKLLQMLENPASRAGLIGAYD